MTMNLVSLEGDGAEDDVIGAWDWDQVVEPLRVVAVGPSVQLLVVLTLVFTYPRSLY